MGEGGGGQFHHFNRQAKLAGTKKFGIQVINHTSPAVLTRLLTEKKNKIRSTTF